MFVHAARIFSAFVFGHERSLQPSHTYHFLNDIARYPRRPLAERVIMDMKLSGHVTDVANATLQTLTCMHIDCDRQGIAWPVINSTPPSFNTKFSLP